MELANARYILFLIDSKIKEHDGKIFCSLKEAREYAKDTINEKYADKAVVGMFVWDSERRELPITMVETIGFQGDKKDPLQLRLFEPTRL
jgi:hypothetical protein